MVLAVAIGITIGVAGSAQAENCAGQRIQTTDGCVGPARVTSTLNRIVSQNLQDTKLQAVIARVDIRGRNLLRSGFGQSQVDVPARPNMNFRIGSMTIPLLTTLVYKLRQQGLLKLSDPVSNWLPNLPGAAQVTVRNLMNNTSGYYDWIQNNPPFQDQVLADPFRVWTGGELLDAALARGSACDPGTCFSYAHTNFLILSRVVRSVVPGTTLVAQLQRQVLRPLGIRLAFSRLAPIPAPTLSSFSDGRGFFEETTGWSPSWGLGNGMLATGSIDNVGRLARGILSGRSLGPWARGDIVRQYAPGIGPNPDRVYFAQGLIMANGWRRQNPFFNGYMGNVAWFPARGIGISLVGTSGPETTAPDGVNVTDAILSDIAAYLTPGNSPALPGAG